MCKWEAEVADFALGTPDKGVGPCPPSMNDHIRPSKEPRELLRWKCTLIDRDLMSPITQICNGGVRPAPYWMSGEIRFQGWNPNRQLLCGTAPLVKTHRGRVSVKMPIWFCQGLGSCYHVPVSTKIQQYLSPGDLKFEVLYLLAWLDSCFLLYIAATCPLPHDKAFASCEVWLPGVEPGLCIYSVEFNS